MNKDHLAQIRQSAQQKIGDRIYKDASQSEQMLREFGDEVASLCGCRAIYGPLKSRLRAEEKVAGRLGGDWFELRDAVRMTLVAPDLNTLRTVQKTIRKEAVAHRGLGIVRDFELSPDQSPCGYSGVNFAIRLQNGRPGEIQVNVPAVMFGQFAPGTFKAALGEAEFHRIRMLKGVDAGLGHAFYEIYRVAKASENGRQAADLSTRYFNCLRRHTNTLEQQTLAADIKAFRVLNEQAFSH